MGNFDIGTAQYQYWLLQVSIFGKFPKMPHKLLKVLANILAIIEISSISLIGYSNTHYLVAFWEISTISPYILAHWQLKQWHFSKFCHLHHKSSVDHASYKYCVICMVKHKYFHYSPHILAHW